MIDTRSENWIGELLPSVLAIARRAGEEIMNVYRGSDNTVMFKSDNSPLTEADLASHRRIVEGLGEIAVQWPILSEESSEIPFDVRRSWEYFWLVDPLDGTKEFIHRNGEFTVNIALIHSGAPILGVVYSPALERAYFAGDGLGASKQEQGRITQIKSIGPPVERKKVVVSRWHSGGQGDLKADFGKIGVDLEGCDVVPMGSSLKFCLVAEGIADLYLRTGPTMEWDTAAAHCVLKNAGGSLHDLEGNPLRYNKPNLVNPGFLATVAGWRMTMPA
jgi:3'(2'), 5'-bisphosphate nucleotidase